jgi:uncharacterized protein
MVFPPAIYVFFGFTATGKSLLGKAWAGLHHLAYFNTDLTRKELAGVPATSRQPKGLQQGIYSPALSRRTYDALLAKAEQALPAGQGVVLDGSYIKREERLRVRDLAHRHNFPVYFVLCTCSESILRERLSLRASDPAAVSDGRWEIYLHQKESFEPPTELRAGELIEIDTTAPVTQLLEQLETAINNIRATGR